MPDRRIEVAFDTRPGDVPIWTDVTTYVRSLNTNRGRSRELDRYQAGRMTAVLDNLDRRFDPTYTSGPYYPNVLPMKRIRFVADGQTQFDGYVDAWNLNYDNPNEAYVEVQATDAFKVLAAAELKSSAYTQDVSGDSPVYWFRLGEPAGSSLIVDSQQAIEGTVVGTATFGQTGLAGDDDTAVAMANGNSGIRVTDSRALIQGTASFSVEALIRTSEASTDVIWQLDGTSSAQIRLRMLGTGILECQLSGANLVFTAETESLSTVNDGATHHVCVTYSTTTNNLKVYVDGADNSNVVLVGTAPYFINAYQLSLANDKSFLVNGWLGTLDEVAFYLRELSAAEIASHASAALTPWEGDTSGERVTRVLDEIGWRSDLRSIDAGESTLQAATLGQSALEHLQKVAESEFGELFATRDGLIRFVQRSNLINLDSAGTFGDSGSDLRYSQIAFDYSDQLIRNDVTINRVDGAAQNVRDEDSIDAFLQQSYTRDQLLHDSDILSRNAAEFIVSEYGEPLLRITQIEILPQHPSGGIFPVILPRDLGDNVTVKRTPPGGGAQISQASRIEGISHTVTPKFWATKWQLSAAYAGTDFFELDDGAGSAPLGLGSSTSDGPALYF